MILFGSPPTPVGTTETPWSRPGSFSVHPHARGDDTCQLGVGHRQRRFTPTPVGTTDSFVLTNALSSVHPHARGDDTFVPAGATSATGSPPRPWGRRLIVAASGQSIRFTPTPVGTTRWRTGRRWPGSPPRPWGRLRNFGLHPVPFRFTPTPVGTTLPDRHTAIRASVHPHARGDDICGVEIRAPGIGSPPRPWGRRVPVPGRQARKRFTPTPVGTTLAKPVARENPSVHPHARGDDWFPNGTTATRLGSPPRPWGRLNGDRPRKQAVRFTPTPVGTT